MSSISTLQEGVTITTDSREVTAEDVTAFAHLTGDMNPLHIDAEWAAQSPFGERVAHGMLVLSFAIGLLDLDHERVVALRQVRNAKWSNPARLGDRIRVEVTVDKATPVGDEGIELLAVSLKVRNQDDALLCRAGVDLLWRGDDAVAEDAV